MKYQCGWRMWAIVTLWRSGGGGREVEHMPCTNEAAAATVFEAFHVVQDHHKAVADFLSSS